MKYPDGQEARLGDVVALGSDQQGIVVCSIDTGEYSDAYPQAQWGYLDAGVLIEFPSYGLIHYKKPEPGLRLLAHASELGAGSNRGRAPKAARPPGRSARLIRFPPKDLEMTMFREIEDIAEIRREIDRLENGLQGLSEKNELKVINAIAVGQRIRVFFFHGGLWWAHRPYPTPPNTATRRNNLFGIGEVTSRSNVEVNLPIDRPRRNLQGALVRCRDGSVLLCHRGNVQHGRRRFSVLDAMSDMGATLIDVAGNTGRLIRVIPVCSIDALQIHEIIRFVRNIVQAKSAMQ